ncbi:MAG: homoserine dehydrogenase [Chloroflexota bacterium]
MPQQTTYRLAFIGFGAVGQGLARILSERGDWLAQRYGAKLVVVAVSTRRGTLYAPDGLDLGQLLQSVEQGGQLPQSNARVDWTPQELVERVTADVLVEVSATDLTTGEPATTYIRTAFDRGMHVVTANKGPIALHGQALLQEAQNEKVHLRYEGTVMSGTPALRLGWGDLAGCTIHEVSGILNGTTNYILTQMEAGSEYADVLAEAQRLGYAEADPSGDVEGFDAAGKAVILANMVFGANLRMDDVACQGITQITLDDVAEARAAGERWKLIARVAQQDGQVVASVQPQRLPLSHPLAGVSGPTNALTYTTDLLGDVTLVGPGAGGTATGFALLADVLAVHGV